MSEFASNYAPTMPNRDMGNLSRLKTVQAHQLRESKPAVPPVPMKPGHEYSFRDTLVNVAENEISRNLTLREIDKNTKDRSDQLKAREILYSDVFIIGTGPHATAFGSRLKALHPDIQMLFADKNPYRGGQFRDTKEAYDLNSPNQAVGGFGFAYEKGKPNDIGQHAVIQSSDISKTPFPKSTDQAWVNTISNYEIDSALVNTKVLSVRKSSTSCNYVVTALDLDTKRTITIYTNTIIRSGGIGDAKVPVVSNNEQKDPVKRPGIVTFPEFLELMRDENLWKIRGRLTRGVAIVGGGDSALVTLEKIIEKQKKHSLFIKHMDMFGAQFANGPEFSKQIIERYKLLAEYMAGNSQDTQTDRKLAVVHPHSEKVMDVFYQWNGIKLKLDGQKDSSLYGLVVMANGQQSSSEDMFSSFGNIEPIDVYDPELKAAIAKRISGEDIYLVGPDAKIPYSQEEIKKIPAHHQARYVNSLRRLIPRTERLATYLGTQEAA